MRSSELNTNKFLPHYILLNNNTKKPIKLKIANRKYFLIVNQDYFSSQDKNDFTLKEKLYILNLPLNITWYLTNNFMLYMLKYFYFCYPLTPKDLKIEVQNGKVDIYVEDYK